MELIEQLAEGMLNHMRRALLLAPVGFGIFVTMLLIGAGLNYKIPLLLYAPIAIWLVLLIQYFWVLRPLQAQTQKIVDRLQSTNRELRDALVTAEQATQTKSRFLAGMSHEIRTPLNGMVGFSEFLLATKLDGQQSEYAQTIQVCSKHLLSILDGLMDFSRLELSKMKLVTESCNPLEVVEEALQMVAPTARSKGLELWNLVEPSLDCQAVCDGHRLRQVLVNLLTNGVKYTPEGMVAIYGQLNDDGRLEFWVEDTGPGIPRDVQAQLFEPFRQLDISVTRRYGGSGLGLAISKGLVELMDGRIQCESVVGKGSIFRFSIKTESVTPIKRHVSVRAMHPENTPKMLSGALEKWCKAWGVELSGADGVRLTFSENPPSDGIWACPLSPGQVNVDLPRLFWPYRWTALRHLLEDGAEEETAATRTAPAEDIKVLVVEDNSVNRKVLCTMLERLGVKVDSVENGQLALDAMDKHFYPVVFMDLAMPVMDGFKATEKIRERYKEAEKPWIIACTAQATPEDRERSFAVGMNDFIPKPIRKESVTASLEKISPLVAKFETAH